MQANLKGAPAEGSALWQLCRVSDVYAPPSDLTYQGFVEAVQSLPDFEPAALLGLAAGADAYALPSLARDFFNDLSLRHNVQHNCWSVEEFAAIALKELPELVSCDRASSRFSASDGRQTLCLNAVMMQEVERYNSLLRCIKSSLECVVEVSAGRTPLSPATEEDAKQLHQAKVPDSWERCSYMSNKPVQIYLQDLGERIQHLRCWIEEGAPPRIWLPGLFAPRGLITAVIQAFTSTQKISMNSVELRSSVVSTLPDKEPEIGIYVQGLFLENCCWDKEHGTLAEPEIGAMPAVLCPLLWLCPREVRAEPGNYRCPVYVVAAGASAMRPLQPNFVCHLGLAAGPVGPIHWLVRGARAVTQTDT